ncbi:MAG: hypothetical protein WC831_02825 [Parcubacteria group bacterium]|jgi:hypothetical protein
MRKKISKFLRRLGNRHNITAIGNILAVCGISFALALVTASFSRYRGAQLQKEKRQSAYSDELKKLSGITTDLKQVSDPTADWKTYENKNHHLSLKYPPAWQDARENFANKGENYLLRISFDEKGLMGGNGVKGFDVFIYSAAKFPGPIGTDDLKKKAENILLEDCPHLDDITLGEKGYPAKEVNVSRDNPCFEETFFYSLTENGYTFNIIPRQEKNKIIFEYGKKIDTLGNFSEFYDIVSTLDFAQQESIIQIPKKIIRRVASPAQVRYTSGARCAEKNDHPRNSKTKGKHMDEDCCPDPDEWPNPHCAYSSSALNLMRARPKK